MTRRRRQVGHCDEQELSHDQGIEDLRAGVRGVAAAGEKYGDANLFVTITMSEDDMPWLVRALAFVGGTRESHKEPGSCAYYFWHLVRALVTNVFGDVQTFGGLTFYADRLENQSQRANKLHAHCILRVEACEGVVERALTADLADLCPSFRLMYEPQARHHCGEKCAGQGTTQPDGDEAGEGTVTCKYGFPVTEYAEETYSRCAPRGKETIYRRARGMERVVPFYPVLKAVYPAHGADMVMTSTVTAAYTGKRDSTCLAVGVLRRPEE